MQKHINNGPKCFCVLDLGLRVRNIVGAKFPVESVCETCPYGKCNLSRSEDQDGRSIYHVCQIDSISLIEKVALTSHLLRRNKKVVWLPAIADRATVRARDLSGLSRSFSPVDRGADSGTRCFSNRLTKRTLRLLPSQILLLLLGI